jgi:hypothetical protein
VVDPDFLYAALDMTACAAFFKESRVRFVNANKPYGKSEGSSGRTAGKNGPPSLNLSLQLPESGRVLSRIFVRHDDCEPPIGIFRTLYPAAILTDWIFYQEKSIFAEDTYSDTALESRL